MLKYNLKNYKLYVRRIILHYNGISHQKKANKEHIINKGKLR